MTNQATKKTTLTELTCRYDGLCQSLASFKSARGIIERRRELDWVHCSAAALRSALDAGVRKTARAADMVERSERRYAEAMGLTIDLQMEAAKAVRMAPSS